MKTKQGLIVLVFIITLFTGASMTFAAQEAAVKLLEGTIWRFKTTLPDDTEEIWQFAAEGELNFIQTNTQFGSDYLDVVFPNAGEWQQKDKTIIISINKGFVTYKGAFSDHTHIKGMASNKNRKKWTFELTQITKPAEIKQYEKIFKEMNVTGTF